jgi:hypothetical protein
MVERVAGGRVRSRAAGQSGRRATPAATYLYGLVRSGSDPLDGRVPRGLAGTGHVRSLPAGKELWLIAADAPLPRFAGAAIDRRLRDLAWVSSCALAHERVVEHIAAHHATLPMKLFTLFSSDAMASAHVRARRSQLLRLLASVAGRDEFGVRLSLDEAAARDRMRRRLVPRGSRSRPGRSFLQLKRDERAASGRLAQASREQADRLFDSLSRLAAAARRRPPEAVAAGKRLLLDAAFLVDRKRAAAFALAVQRSAGRLAPEGYALALNGPWPPYNFAGEMR